MRQQSKRGGERTGPISSTIRGPRARRLRRALALALPLLCAASHPGVAAPPDSASAYQVRVVADGTLWRVDGASERKLVAAVPVMDVRFTKFIFEPQADGSYRIRVETDDRYLHVDAGAPEQALNTRWQPVATDPCTRFGLEENADGSYRIKVQCSGRYLHVDAGSPARLVSTLQQPGAGDPYTHFALVGGRSPAQPPEGEVTGLNITDFVYDSLGERLDFRQVAPSIWEQHRYGAFWSRFKETSRSEEELILRDDDRQVTYRVNLSEGRVYYTYDREARELLTGFLKATSASRQIEGLGEVTGLDLTAAVDAKNTIYRQIGQGRWQQVFPGGGANLLEVIERAPDKVVLSSALYEIDIDLATKRIYQRMRDRTVLIPDATREIAGLSNDDSLLSLTGSNVRQVTTTAGDTLIQIGESTWRSRRGAWLIYSVVARDDSSVRLRHFATDNEMILDLEDWQVHQVAADGSKGGSLGTIRAARAEHSFEDQIQEILDAAEGFDAPAALIRSGIAPEELHGKTYKGELIFYADPQTGATLRAGHSPAAPGTTGHNVRNAFGHYFGREIQMQVVESADDPNTWERYEEGVFADLWKVEGRGDSHLELRDDARGLDVRLSLPDGMVYTRADGEASEKLAGFLLGADTDYVIFEDVLAMPQSDLKAVTEWIKNKVTGVKLPYCWKQSYGRGAGEVASACASSDLEKDATGGPAGLCYPKCRSGYDGVGPVCWQSCPSGFRDDGAFCRKPDEYGRGAGRVPDVSCPSGFSQRGLGALAWCDNRATWPWDLETRAATASCRSDEEMNAGLCYKKCKPGYEAVGCCICTYSCPAGFGTDIGVSCTKKTYGRGVGELSTCRSGTIRDETGGPAGLCYPECRSGFHGVGPVCWQSCPADWIDCGAGCAEDEMECAMTTLDQVSSVAILAANIATLGLSTPATAGAKAGTQAATKGGKAVTGTTKLSKAFVKVINKLQTVEPTGLAKDAKVMTRVFHARTGLIGATKSKAAAAKAVWRSGTTGTRVGRETYRASLEFSQAYAEAFAEQTSPEINREIDNRFAPAAADYIKAHWGRNQLAEMAGAKEFQLAQDVLAVVSIVDISGVTGVASAYTKPICEDVIPFPTLSQYYK